MDIKKLNEDLRVVINELSDELVNKVHRERVSNFKKAEKDFYNGENNVEELRDLKRKLDRNKDLTFNREERKNYNGRYLKVEYDGDPCMYDMYIDDQISQGRTEEELEKEDAKCYTIWLTGVDGSPLESDKNGKQFDVNYVSIWAIPGWIGLSDEEIISKAKMEWGDEVIPNDIKVEWK